MVGGSTFLRLFRLVFREQKTRLQIEWLTHTDEQILEHLAAVEADDPATIARSLDRSVEYVSDRCRQLAIRGLTANVGEASGAPRYELTDLGHRYLADEVDAEELDSLSN